MSAAKATLLAALLLALVACGGSPRRGDATPEAGPVDPGPVTWDAPPPEPRPLPDEPAPPEPTPDDPDGD
ncbi:MAG: hypothetical protein CMH57_12220 [Myxococcales bacterium]|nr:hypothetical protein [Myxococcales bacterium]